MSEKNSPPPIDEAAILRAGRRILEEEGLAILAKKDALGDPFVQLVQHLLGLRGKVGITGVGKSGIVGEKISATLSSTGTPSLFLKPVDALHGDLGVLRDDDFLIAISNSGETAEVLAVAQAANALGVGVAALTGNPQSSLAKLSDVNLDIGVRGEACPLGLAPTTSTTVTLAVGDALAMVLIELRGFTAGSYARFHPAGALGQRLRYRVRDIMRCEPHIPVVEESGTFANALRVMTETDNLGVTLAVDETGRLVGIVTDGDVRRILMREGDSNKIVLSVRDVMTRDPKVVDPDSPASEALQMMESRGISSLAVVDPRDRPVGLVHLHDILGRGKVVL